MRQSKYFRVLRFVTHYWLLSPALFGVLVAARLGSTLIDVSVPVASGRVVDAVAKAYKDEVIDQDAGIPLRPIQGEGRLSLQPCELYR